MQSGPVVPTATASDKQIAPISGVGNIGVRRGEIKQGVREVTLCKDGSGKVGMCLEAINKVGSRDFHCVLSCNYDVINKY